MTDKFSVIGIRHSKGNYNGFDFDNYYFHTIRPANEESSEQGQICEIFEKIKASSLEFVPQIGDFVTPVYDKHGKVRTLLICD